MTSIVQTMTVSPAFMQEIKEDDLRLQRLLNEFRQVISGQRLTQSGGRRLAALVSNVRDHVAFHFALEEAFGYFEDPVAVAPRLCERVEELRAEHVDLFTEVCRIVDVFEDSAPGLPADLTAVQDMCCEFLGHFEAHEAAENALISQAFNEDLGVGD